MRLPGAGSMVRERNDKALLHKKGLRETVNMRWDNFC